MLLLVCCITAAAASVFTALIIPTFQAGKPSILGDRVEAIPTLPETTLSVAGALCHLLMLKALSIASQWLLPLALAISTGSLPVIHSALCLRLLCNALVQESRKATSKTKALDNFFTFSFKHNYSYACCGLLRAVLNPITYLFHFSHVLLLALVLCPSSRIINLDSKETDESHSQPRLHARLRWVRSKSLTDLKARRSLLMSSAVLLLRNYHSFNLV